MTDPLPSWVAQVSAELGVDPALVDIAAVLDLARDAAHGVARPAAPLTTFLVGLAAGQQGGDAAAIAALIARVQALALDFGPAEEA